MCASVGVCEYRCVRVCVCTSVCVCIGDCVFMHELFVWFFNFESNSYHINILHILAV